MTAEIKICDLNLTASFNTSEPQRDALFSPVIEINSRTSRVTTRCFQYRLCVLCFLKRFFKNALTSGSVHVCSSESVGFLLV